MTVLLKRQTLEGIRRGTVHLAFRRWKRPTVRSGGTLLTPIGQLAIEAVDRIEIDDVDAAAATAAGYDDPTALRRELAARSGDLYRVRLSLQGPDPRIGLREAVPVGPEIDAILERLAKIDARARNGAWTSAVLIAIERAPATRAADLAATTGIEPAVFKRRVRRLNALGLTESLGTGYQLSPRGEAVLAATGEPAR